MTGKANLGLLRAAAVCAIALAWLATGCATSNVKILERHDAQGRPYTFKRIERFPQRDFLHHWVRKAYCPAKASFRAKGNPSGAALIEDWGQPTWIRKPFRSLLDERVEEWLYIDRNALFQFIGGELVYEGLVTDYERTLLARGYPDRALALRKEDDRRAHVFVYERVFNPMLEEYRFDDDGTIIQSEEGK